MLASLALLSLLVAPVGLAFEDELPQRLQHEPLEQVYQWLLAQPQPAPSGAAARYHRWLGQMAMQLEDYARATRHLEAAVLAYPRDLGSRLDLAIAYARLGNVPAARASLRGLHAYLGEEPLPPAAARELAQLERRLEKPRVEGGPPWWSQASGAFSVAQGYDSNANLGSRHRTIPLSLFGRYSDEAWLADDSRPQPSQFTRFDLHASLPLSTKKNDAWHLLAGASGQRYRDLDSLHRWDAYLGAQWQPHPPLQKFSVMLQQQNVQGIGNLWYLETDYRRMFSAHWMAEIGAQWQREPTGQSSYRLNAGLWYEWQRMLLWGSASWQYRPERLAGDTWRMRLGGQTPAWSWKRLDLTGYAHLEWRQDTETYNYVFFGDVSRRDTTATLGARARLPLAESLDLLVDARWEHSRASLELFENQRWTLEAALQWRW